MSASGIEWTDATWNPLRGCSRHSPGCGGGTPGDLKGGCYAERIAARFSGPGQPYEGLAVMRGGHARWTGKLALAPEETITAPLRLRRPRMIFVNSMSDLFHEAVPDAWIDRVFTVMALCPQHTFQVLTKRSARMRAYMTGDWYVRVYDAVSGTPSGAAACGWLAASRPLPNVWLGISAENDSWACERIPDLRATPAAVKFASLEPLLGPIDLLGILDLDAAITDNTAPLDWVIVGGESGPSARPMHPDWARSIRNQCEASGIAFFFKQWGAWGHSEQVPPPVPGRSAFDVYGRPAGESWHFWTYGDRGSNASIRIGKKAAGRMLDGRIHDAMPRSRA